jgi:LysR family transcriptional regulator for metE and metH
VLELKHLKTLKILKETGSLAEAANRLCLTHSAISHQIAELEDKTGCVLFIRKTKPIRFTLAGEKLLQLAEQVLPQIRKVEFDLAKLAQGQTGRLNIAIECHSCFQWLMPTILEFRHHFPDVEVDLSTAFNFNPLTALMRGDLDCVITSDPLEHAGIHYIPLFRYELLLALPPHHPLTEKPYIEPIDLATETLIIYPVEQSRLDIFRHFLDPAHIEPQQIRSCELTMMMVQLVMAGRGVCALPNWALTEYLTHQYVTAKPCGAKGIWSTLYAAIRLEQSDHAYLQCFIQNATETSLKLLHNVHSVTEKTKIEKIKAEKTKG